MVVLVFIKEVKMRFSKVLMLSSVFGLCAFSARAQSALQMEIDALREDVQVLQRQAYRDKENGITPASAQDVAVKMGQFDETLRQSVGKIDELEYKIKTLEERINVINKDVDIRLKMMEGKSIEGSAGLGAQATPAAKFEAPVAKGAPASIVGAEVSKGNDLPPVKTKSAEEIYQEGMDALKANNNDEAAAKFTTVLSKFPEHKLAGNAQYWLGEAYYAKKDYAKAAVAFAKGYEKYKDGNKGADNILKLGMSMKELGKKDEACTAFINLPKEFPKAEESVKVKAAQLAGELQCK